MAVSFDFRTRLGSGHFGEVWYAINVGLDCPQAVKCIPPEKIVNQNNFYQEAQTLKAAEHPNIVVVYETGTLNDGRIYVAMEYLPRGSVEDEARGGYIPLSRAKCLMSDVLRGLHHAHERGIVHRDIKPANILVRSTGEGKLSDFGLALPNIGSLDISSVKQYHYLLHLAPEVDKLGDYSIQADIYAAGVTLYRLVNGDNYLPSINPDEVRDLSQRGRYPDRKRYRGFISQKMRRLINKAMNVEPARRFQSADEMRHALEQVSTEMDWGESTSSRGTKWDGSKGDLKVVVERLAQADGGWSVVVKKGRRALRKDNALSKWNLTEAEAKRHSYRVLQEFVNRSR